MRNPGGVLRITCKIECLCDSSTDTATFVREIPCTYVVNSTAPLLFFLAPTVPDPWVLHEVSASSPSKGATISFGTGASQKLEASLLLHPLGSLSPGALLHATAGRTRLRRRVLTGLRPKLLLAHLSQNVAP